MMAIECELLLNLSVQSTAFLIRLIELDEKGSDTVVIEKGKEGARRFLIVVDPTTYALVHSRIAPLYDATLLYPCSIFTNVIQLHSASLILRKIGPMNKWCWDLPYVHVGGRRAKAHFKRLQARFLFWPQAKQEENKRKRDLCQDCLHNAVRGSVLLKLQGRVSSRTSLLGHWNEP